MVCPPLRGYTRLSGGRHLHEAIAFPRAVISLLASLFPLASALQPRTSKDAAVTTVPSYPQKHFLTRHIPPYAPPTALHDILCLLYDLCAHECHVKITARTPVQSFQSQPRRSTGTLIPPPSHLPLPMAISRGNQKVQKAILHGFQDDHQSPRPLPPFTPLPVPYTQSQDPANPSQLDASQPHDLSGSLVWLTPRTNGMVDVERQRIKHEPAILVTSEYGPALLPRACPRPRFPR